MELTKDQLQHLIPSNKNIDEWYAALSRFLPEYEIDTKERIAAFISQCAHESAEFTALRENLNYRASVLCTKFKKYFPTEEFAKSYVNRPDKQEAIANRIYANRMGNGDEASGDGFRYRGRGLIQITGKDNYTRFADSIGIPVKVAANYLETIDGAVESACWFWKINKLNDLADQGNIEKMTKVINGGYNGLEERKARYEEALSILES